MKTLYTYELINSSTGKAVSYANTRKEARDVKRKFAKRKENVKIVQNKYSLAEQKVVR